MMLRNHLLLLYFVTVKHVINFLSIINQKILQLLSRKISYFKKYTLYSFFPYNDVFITFIYFILLILYSQKSNASIFLYFIHSYLPILPLIICISQIFSLFLSSKFNATTKKKRYDFFFYRFLIIDFIFIVMLTKFTSYSSKGSYLSKFNKRNWLYNGNSKVCSKKY